MTTKDSPERTPWRRWRRLLTQARVLVALGERQEAELAAALLRVDLRMLDDTTMPPADEVEALQAVVHVLRAQREARAAFLGDPARPVGTFEVMDGLEVLRGVGPVEADDGDEGYRGPRWH